MDIKTRNRGTAPALVQVWVDNGHKTGDINEMKVPFILTPPVYRVEPGKGQSLRMIYNGMQMLQDRETLFWFNLLEIPPAPKDKKTNRLDLAFRTRIKVFYRPVTLDEDSVSVAEKLNIQLMHKGKSVNGIKVSNPTPYYFSLDSAAISGGNGLYDVKSDMIPPFGDEQFLTEKSLPENVTINDVKLNIINDFGAIKTKEYVLKNNEFALDK